MKILRVNQEYENLLLTLKADCSKCNGLCCMALYFSKIDGFPEDKPPGQPCKNLLPDFRCRVHSALAEKGLTGCRAYDCFGAGQHVVQYHYQGKSWAELPEQAGEMTEVFFLLWRLYQMRWYLCEAGMICSGLSLKQQVDGLILENKNRAGQPPAELLTMDLTPHKKRVDQALKEAAKTVSANFSTKPLGGGDLIGKSFRGKNLDGQDFSMALLLAADLEGCSLYGANFLGADLRDANLKNTDLRQSLFLTQGQVNAACGNKNTKLPLWLDVPSAWKGGQG